MAYDIGPKIGIEGEKEFKNSIKAVESQLKALGKELQALSKEYDENDRSVEGAPKNKKALQSAVDATKTKISCSPPSTKSRGGAPAAGERSGDSPEGKRGGFGTGAGGGCLRPPGHRRE